MVVEVASCRVSRLQRVLFAGLQDETSSVRPFSVDKLPQRIALDLASGRANADLQYLVATQLNADTRNRTGRGVGPARATSSREMDVMPPVKVEQNWAAILKVLQALPFPFVPIRSAGSQDSPQEVGAQSGSFGAIPAVKTQSATTAQRTSCQVWSNARRS